MPTNGQVAQLLTAEDLLNMPEDGFRYELVKGELIKMPPAGGEHGEVVGKFWKLARFIEEHDLGTFYAAETGFLWEKNPDTVRAPDVAFMRKERAQRLGSVKGYIPEAPDLVVEVLSPNDIYGEVEEKVRGWLRFGTRMVMVVNPRYHTVTVYYQENRIQFLTEQDEMSGGDIVPGWTMPVSDLFK